jgi:hypothetical protein
VWIRHRENGTDTLHHTTALVAEAGYDLGDYTPYVRYENTQFSDRDPYFATSGIASQDSQRVSMGVKYIASASVAFKVQTEVLIGAADTGYRAIGQAAFAF